MPSLQAQLIRLRDELARVREDRGHNRLCAEQGDGQIEELRRKLREMAADHQAQWDEGSVTNKTQLFSSPSFGGDREASPEHPANLDEVEEAPSVPRDARGRHRPSAFGSAEAGSNAGASATGGARSKTKGR